MSKSNEAFSEGFEQVNAIVQEQTPGERGGGGARAARRLRIRQKFEAGRLITLDEFLSRRGL